MVTFALAPHSAFMCFDFQVIPLTYRAWQQTSYQDNARAQFSNSSTLLLEPEFQWDPEEVQVNIGQFFFFLPVAQEMLYYVSVS